MASRAGLEGQQLHSREEMEAESPRSFGEGAPKQPSLCCLLAHSLTMADYEFHMSNLREWVFDSFKTVRALHRSTGPLLLCRFF